MYHICLYGPSIPGSNLLPCKGDLIFNYKNKNIYFMPLLHYWNGTLHRFLQMQSTPVHLEGRDTKKVYV